MSEKLIVIDMSEVSYCPDPDDPHNPTRDVRERGNPLASLGFSLIAHQVIDLPPDDPGPSIDAIEESGRYVPKFLRPHIATLPDGTTVNLPAGTVLREGTDPMAFSPTEEERRRRGPCDGCGKPHPNGGLLYRCEDGTYLCGFCPGLEVFR